MNSSQYYNKVDECIARFKNGKERYRTSVEFNYVIEMLARGEDPHEVIDSLCQTIEKQRRAFEQYVIRDSRPIVMDIRG